MGQTIPTEHIETAAKAIFETWADMKWEDAGADIKADATSEAIAAIAALTRCGWEPRAQ